MRIYARLQEGWSYEALAAAENLSRERIRQIVKARLDRREVDPDADFVRLQMARLDPALRLASEKVASGDLKAIDRLLRVLDRMDKYQSAAVCDLEDESIADQSLADEGDDADSDLDAEERLKRCTDCRRSILDRVFALAQPAESGAQAASVNDVRPAEKDKTAEAARRGGR